MSLRVIEIAESGRHLALDRGFMSVRDGGHEIGKVPLDDIAAIIATGYGLTYSGNLLTAAAEHGIPVVICAPNHLPAVIAWPVDGHHIQSARIRSQVEASMPTIKRLWQSLVRAKIHAQADILDLINAPGAEALRRIARDVRSGDPTNIEAQAARRYWPSLMGQEFRRDRAAPDANALLNYGYAILRAGTARGVMAAGLHPSIGLHHQNRYNAMCLVDDLMEPFRPLVDFAVYQLWNMGARVIDRETKPILAGVLHFDLETTAGTTPLVTCLIRLAQSLAQALDGTRETLDLPLKPTPLQAQSWCPQSGRPASELPASELHETGLPQSGRQWPPTGDG